MRWWDRLTRTDSSDSTTPAARSRVDVRTAADLQRDGAVLVDVREQQEWSAGHAPKARHLPLGRLGEAQRTLRPDATLLTICRSGARSARAARTLRSAGFTVIDVSGGMSAWQRAGLPVVANGGRPGRIS